MKNDSRAIAELFATASLGAPENAVGFVLWRIVHRYQREIDRALAPLNLTHLQFTVLVLAAWLGRAGEAVAQSEMAQFGDIHPMQVSHMLKALKEKRLVERTKSLSDARAKHVKITAAGVATLHSALPIVNEVQRRLFGKGGAPGGTLLNALLRVDGRAQ